MSATVRHLPTTPLAPVLRLIKVMTTSISRLVPPTPPWSDPLADLHYDFEPGIPSNEDPGLPIIADGSIIAVDPEDVLPPIDDD